MKYYNLAVLICAILLLWPFSVNGESSPSDTIGGQCFTKDECARLYSLRAQDPSLSSSTRANYAEYPKRYGDNFINRVWEERKDLCAGREDVGFCRAPEPLIGLSVSIPGLGGSVHGVSEYISSLYRFSVYFASILSVFWLLIAGYKWLVAMGNPSKISAAKDLIARVLKGLVLILFSFVILKVINPDLVSLSFKGPTLFRTRGLGGQCVPLSEETTMGVSGEDGAKYILDKKGKISGQETATCGRRFFPSDKEKYGETCTGSYCPFDLTCGLDKGCDLEIARGAFNYSDPKNRYITEVALYRAVDALFAQDQLIACSPLKKGQSSFSLKLSDFVKDVSSIGGEGSAFRVSYDTFKVEPGDPRYDKYLKDTVELKGYLSSLYSDNPLKPNYYFKIIINDTVFNDQYFVGRDCKVLGMRRAGFGASDVERDGIATVGAPPFLEITCDVNESNLPTHTGPETIGFEPECK